KQSRDVRQISHPELHDQMPVIINDDKDPAGIMLAETKENGILICFMRNKYWLQTDHPIFCNQRDKTPRHAIMGAFWESQVILAVLWQIKKIFITSEFPVRLYEKAKFLPLK
ncbi:hypothetical protein, partial [Desulfosporosinus sp. BICA1-9]|uniref:hypothetical protein n=2 Tax=Desulfosporosinus sp. BICA1-9 TaxID=1531958 RepID=UPI00054BF985